MSNVDQAWYESETPKPVSEVTLQEFEQLCAAIANQRLACDEKEEALKEENKKLAKLEQQVLSYLREMKRDSYKSSVGTVGISRRRSWALPQGDDRTKFFGYLKELGVFDGMITVHSATYNSFLKEKFEKAEEDGESAGFSVPGVGQASVFETIRFTKGK
jgi:hypothetical protein